MSFQKCPVCEGSAREPFPSHPAAPGSFEVCHTCQGKCIISTITGLPPTVVQVVPGTPVPDLKAEEIIVPVSPFDDLSDDEITFYSTPYFDELQAKKLSQAAARKEQE